MDFYISSLDQVPANCHLYNVTHVISLLRSSTFEDVVLPSFIDRSFNWLRLDMDDVIDPDHPSAPKLQQIIHILDWTSRLPSDSKILIHCQAGIGRSTAVALMLKTRELGIDKIDDAVSWLIDHRPTASPNPVITLYADQMLGANGKLYHAAEQLAMSKLLLLYNDDVNMAMSARNHQTN